MFVLKNISPAELMRDAQNANNSKNIKCQPVKVQLVIHNKPREFAGELKFLNWLQELEAVQAVLSQDGAGTDAIIESVETDESRFDLQRLWQHLVDAERDLHPSVTVANPPKRRGRNYTIEIQEDISVFEHFDSNDRVQIISDLPDQRWVYGTLAIGQSQGDTLMVEDARSMEYLKAGTRLKLAEQLSETSWQRRRRALYAILEGEALIPDLVGWFDPAISNPPVAVAPLPSHRMPALRGIILTRAKQKHSVMCSSTLLEWSWGRLGQAKPLCCPLCWITCCSKKRWGVFCWFPNLTLPLMSLPAELERSLGRV